MKVVISGYYGFDNIGDEAILKSIIMALKEEDKNIEITVLSSNPIETKKNYNVNAISRWSINSIYKELLKSDGLISGGGSLLQDVTSSRSILYYTSVIGMARFMKKPVVVYAQGVGPINKNSNKKIVKHFLNKVQYISLRDNESFELIKSIGVKTKVDIVPDPVMGLDFKDIDRKVKDDKYIIISVRDWSTKQNYLNHLAESCNEIIKKGIGVKILPMHGNLDEETSKRLANMIKYDVEILSHKINIEKKLKYIREAKVMIGMRLHALIFAGNVGTPMIGISYDPKVDSYLKLVDQPCLGNVNEGIKPKELTEKVLYIIDNHEDIKSNLEKYTRELKATAKLTAKNALTTFKKDKAKGDKYE